ncbi:MAG: hypothetical protein AB7I37_25305 [Pirellulales bacterium]
MSIEALLEAAETRLIEQLGFAEGEVSIAPDGKPPAKMGERFVSLDENSIQSTERASLKENYAITVYITIRTGKLPADNRKKAYLSHLKALTGIERAVIKALHGRQEVRLAACNLLGISNEAMQAEDQEDRDNAPGGDASRGHPFTIPLYYTGRQRTNTRADWILGSEASPAPCMVRELQFAGGLRLQSLDTIQ